jgi:hypothetical protein
MQRHSFEISQIKALQFPASNAHHTVMQSPRLIAQVEQTILQLPAVRLTILCFPACSRTPQPGVADRRRLLGPRWAHGGTPAEKGGAHVKASCQSRKASSFQFQSVLHQISHLLALDLGIGGAVDSLLIGLRRYGLPSSIRHQSHQLAVVCAPVSRESLLDVPK